jgi:transcription elongation factor GreA
MCSHKATDFFRFRQEKKTMSDSIPMTREGYNKIRAEVERLETEEMPEILERLANARAEGDLSENAEYHGARESQGMLQARINELKSKLARAAILDPADMPQGEVRFGATVKVQRKGSKKPETYTLVGAGDEDYDSGKILASSPLAQGFLGKKKGETAAVRLPKGETEFTILDVRYD